MERVDLLSDFRKEIEVLELTDEYMIYALDQKNELKDICSLERIYFADHRIERLLSLDYTRLWEHRSDIWSDAGLFLCGECSG